MSQQKWMMPRRPDPPILSGNDDEIDVSLSITYLGLFRSQWLICIYMEDRLVLWDLDSIDGNGRVDRRWCRRDLLKQAVNATGLVQCSSANAASDPNAGSIVVAMTSNVA
jgi:hypothetical protein